MGKPIQTNTVTCGSMETLMEEGITKSIPPELFEISVTRAGASIMGILVRLTF